MTPLITSPSNITYPKPEIVDGKYTLGGTQGPVTGNSIILDAPVSFNKDNIYRFSLLTPTYNYQSTGITDLSSDEEVRRTSIQDLYFLGAHTQTVSGYYNSDYEEGGSGIATQIYFHTGLMVDDNTPIGRGNQLDFDNYVITGYTNNYVNGSTVTSYSGGCFSGSNLVWSAENDKSTSDEYVSGNFSNYRIINVTENDDSTSYAIAALAYSTGKYDNVEDKLSFQTVTIDERPKFPYVNYTAPDPDTKGVGAFGNILLGNPNERGDDYGDVNETPKYKKYSTFEIRVPQASTRLKSAVVQGSTEEYSIQTQEQYTVKNRMSYQVCVMDQDVLGNGFGDSNLDPTNVNLFKVAKTDPSTTDDYVGTIYHEVSDDDYINLYRRYALYTIDGDFTKKADEGGFAWSAGNGNSHYFFLEKMLTKDTNYWFAVFAFNNFTRSTEAMVGLILKSTYENNVPAAFQNNKAIINNIIPTSDSFNLVEGMQIKNLTSSDLIGTRDDSRLNPINSTQPTYTWTANAAIDFYDDFNKPLNIVEAQDFRITICSRAGQETLKNNEIPSSNIFVEITGYNENKNGAAFDFILDYNNPHVISSLAGNPDVQKYKADGEITSSLDETAWFREDTTGIIFRNSPNNYPLREFDIVIEAHDTYGNTSSPNNKIWNNTIRGEDTSNKYSNKDGYDFISCTLGIPSGVVFAQYDVGAELLGNDDKDALDDYRFLDQGQSYTRNYPYLATAELFTNGELHLSVQPSTDEAGNKILTETEIRNAFPDVRGIVYYYTTGDNSMIDEMVEDNTAAQNGLMMFNPNNKAPFFAIKEQNIGESSKFGLQGNVKYTTNSDPESYADSPAKLNDEVTAPNNCTIYRYYHLFNDATDASRLVINFPKIAAANVQNIYLTIAFFDSLSYLQHFNADNSPKTASIIPDTDAQSNTTSTIPGVYVDPIDGSKTVLDPRQAVPTILTDGTLKFSRTPTKVWNEGEGGVRNPVKWSTPTYDEFATANGSPIFLKERSLQTINESSLAYRAWWDIKIDPGEVNLTMDFTRPSKGKPAYRGSYIKTQSGSVQRSNNKNKMEGIARIEVTPLAHFRVKDNEMNFARSAEIKFYFDRIRDPERYSVDLEFEVSNQAIASAISDGQPIKMTKGNNPTNINRSTRDFPTVQDASLTHNCKLIEKSDKYVKLEVGPFASLAPEMQQVSSEMEWVVEWFVPDETQDGDWEFSSHSATRVGKDSAFKIGGSLNRDKRKFRNPRRYNTDQYLWVKDSAGWFGSGGTEVEGKNKEYWHKEIFKLEPGQSIPLRKFSDESWGRVSGYKSNVDNDGANDDVQVQYEKVGDKYSAQVKGEMYLMRIDTAFNDRNSNVTAHPESADFAGNVTFCCRSYIRSKQSDGSWIYWKDRAPLFGEWRPSFAFYDTRVSGFQEDGFMLTPTNLHKKQSSLEYAGDIMKMNSAKTLTEMQYLNGPFGQIISNFLNNKQFNTEPKFLGSIIRVKGGVYRSENFDIIDA